MVIILADFDFKGFVEREEFIGSLLHPLFHFFVRFSQRVSLGIQFGDITKCTYRTCYHAAAVAYGGGVDKNVTSLPVRPDNGYVHLFVVTPVSLTFERIAKLPVLMFQRVSG